MLNGYYCKFRIGDVVRTDFYVDSLSKEHAKWMILQVFPTARVYSLKQAEEYKKITNELIVVDFVERKVVSRTPLSDAGPSIKVVSGML